LTIVHIGDIKMFSIELRNLIFQVITSWQVIAVTLAVLLYVFLINYVIKARRRYKKTPAQKKAKKSKAAADDAEVDDSDLGLEE